MKKALSVLIIVSIIFSLAACGKSKLKYDPKLFEEYFTEKSADCQNFNSSEFDTAYVTDLDKNGIPEVGYTFNNWSNGPISVVTVYDGELIEIEIPYPGSDGIEPDGVYYVGNYIIMYAEGQTMGSDDYFGATIYKVENGNITEVESVTRESLEIAYTNYEDYGGVDQALQKEKIRNQMFEYLDENYGFLSADYYNDVCVKENTFDYINEKVGCNIKEVSTAKEEKATSTTEAESESTTISKSSSELLTFLEEKCRNRESNISLSSALVTDIDDNNHPELVISEQYSDFPDYIISLKEDNNEYVIDSVQSISQVGDFYPSFYCQKNISKHLYYCNNGYIVAAFEGDSFGTCGTAYAVVYKVDDDGVSKVDTKTFDYSAGKSPYKLYSNNQINREAVENTKEYTNKELNKYLENKYGITEKRSYFLSCTNEGIGSYLSKELHLNFKITDAAQKSYDDNFYFKYTCFNIPNAQFTNISPSDDDWNRLCQEAVAYWYYPDTEFDSTSTANEIIDELGFGSIQSMLYNVTKESDLDDFWSNINMITNGNSYEVIPEEYFDWAFENTFGIKPENITTKSYENYNNGEDIIWLYKENGYYFYKVPDEWYDNGDPPYGKVEINRKNLDGSYNVTAKFYDGYDNELLASAVADISLRECDGRRIWQIKSYSVNLTDAYYRYFN